MQKQGKAEQRTRIIFLGAVVVLIAAVLIAVAFQALKSDPDDRELFMPDTANGLTQEEFESTP